MEQHGWRVALVVAAVAMGSFAAGLFSAGAAPTALFGVVPVLVWCADPRRSRRVGVPVGLVLLALLAWFALPHGPGWSGRWVPSAAEVLWLYPLLAAVVCLVGGRADRGRPGCVPVAAVVVLGFVLALGDLVGLDESLPGDEGLLPGPAGVRAVEPAPVCGSGGCSRVVEFAADPALVLRHLRSRGFTAPSEHDTGWACRVTGVLVERRACARVRGTAGGAQVTWRVD